MESTIHQNSTYQDQKCENTHIKIKYLKLLHVFANATIISSFWPVNGKLVNQFGQHFMQWSYMYGGGIQFFIL